MVEVLKRAASPMPEIDSEVWLLSIWATLRAAAAVTPIRALGSIQPAYTDWEPVVVSNTHCAVPAPITSSRPALTGLPRIAAAASRVMRSHTFAGAARATDEALKRMNGTTATVRPDLQRIRQTVS